MKEISLFFVIVVVAGITVYFVPAIIAGVRGHMDRLAIFALNLLLGWTAIGWIAALIWSLTGNVQEPSFSYGGHYDDEDLPRTRRGPFQM